ncbi:MAG TPA: sugar-binding domain-containing protein [Candidatus Obscuribacterales bacterium]
MPIQNLACFSSLRSPTVTRFPIHAGCLLHQDGFINDAEVTELMTLGAAGEIAGWAYDREGCLIPGATNSRVASVPLEQPAQRLVIGVAGGVKKAEAILAALRGKLINGLITDEAAAQAILAKI